MIRSDKFIWGCYSTRPEENEIQGAPGLLSSYPTVTELFVASKPWTQDIFTTLSEVTMHTTYFGLAQH